MIDYIEIPKEYTKTKTVELVKSALWQDIKSIYTHKKKSNFYMNTWKLKSKPNVIYNLSKEIQKHRYTLNKICT